MKTHTIQVFEFLELSPAAQAKAIARQCESAAEDCFLDWVREDFKTCARLLGFGVADTFYSLAYCQGDGASFTGDWRASRLDVAAMGALKAHAPQDATLHAIADELARIAAKVPEGRATITQSGRYSHSHTMRFELEAWPHETEDAGAAVDFASVTRRLADWLYQQLLTEYEYQTGEACARETLENDSDTEFLADGRFYRG